MTLTGNINDTNDAGGGISITGNTGGSTVLSGTTKTLNTGLANAVAFSNSDGHTLTLSGGGLDVDTTSGAGRRGDDCAAPSTSSELGNTIDTGTGTALTVSDTDVGREPLGVPARSPRTAAGGGIRLSNTGANAALTVASSGAGTCTAADQTGCTGGVIQNSDRRRQRRLAADRARASS